MVFRGHVESSGRSRPSRLGLQVGWLVLLLLGLPFAIGACMVTGAAHAADGEALFETACATCHLGGGGLLGASRTPDLFRDPLLRGESVEALAQAIRFGIEPPRMPRFEQGLAPDEIDAIVAYVFAQRAAMRGEN